MSTQMKELPNKMKNKHDKYFIMKQDDVIKLFWNKYIWKKTFQAEELTEHSDKVI